MDICPVCGYNELKHQSKITHIFGKYKNKQTGEVAILSEEKDEVTYEKIDSAGNKIKTTWIKVASEKDKGLPAAPSKIEEIKPTIIPNPTPQPNKPPVSADSKITTPQQP